MESRSRSRYRVASPSEKASTVCWPVRSAVGRSVTQKCSTLLRRCSMIRNTKRYTQAYGRNREEVYGDDLAQVIPQEGLPGLGGNRFRCAECAKLSAPPCRASAARHQCGVLATVDWSQPWLESAFGAHSGSEVARAYSAFSRSQGQRCPEPAMTFR